MNTMTLYSNTVLIQQHSSKALVKSYSQQLLKSLSTYCVPTGEGSGGYTHLHLQSGFRASPRLATATMIPYASSDL